MNGRQQRSQAPGDRDDPSGSRESIECRELAVVAEPGQGQVGRVELGADDCPNMPRRLPAAVTRSGLVFRETNVQPQRGPEGTSLEPDDPRGREGGGGVPGWTGAGDYGAPEAPDDAVVEGALAPALEPPTALRIVTVGRRIRVGSAATDPWTSATRAASSSRRAW